MARTKKAAPRRKPRPQFTNCLCGCGKALKKGRMFAQGHDMRLKSLVLKVKAGEVPASEIPAIALPILRGRGVGGLRIRA